MRERLLFVAPSWVGWVGFALCVAAGAVALFTDLSLWWLGLLGFLLVAASFDPGKWTDTEAGRGTP